MNIITADVKYLNIANKNPYMAIETAGKIYYKPESYITNESAVNFVKDLIKNDRTSMLEHGYIYMIVKENIYNLLMQCIRLVMENDEYRDNITPYLNITRHVNSINHLAYISGSFRTFLNLFDSDISFCFNGVPEIKAVLSKTYPEVFIDKNGSYNIWQTNDIQILTQKEFIKQIKNDINNDAKQKTIDNILIQHIPHTLAFICSKETSYEFIKHRPALFTQENKECINYANTNPNEITFIPPLYWSDDNSIAYIIWENACHDAERAYIELLKEGIPPQQAASILPGSLKTELVITATENKWKHFLNLKYHKLKKDTHPQIKEIMEIAYPLLKTYSNNRL